jgi:hypothetical protein
MLMPPYWNDAYYLDLHADVKSAVENGWFANGWMHYRKWGVREGRRDGYLLSDKDLSYYYQAKSEFATCPPKINLVIAAYSGLRRDQFQPYVEDRTYYLQIQLQALQNLKHNLSQITIVAPRHEEESLDYARFLETIPPKIGSTDVVVLRRENYGQSYGSYSFVYDKYRDAFDYYILIEDDYVFVKNHFDLELATWYKCIPNCGFLCSFVWEDQSPDQHKLHAAIANGVVSAETLGLIWEKFNCIPHGIWNNAKLNETTKYNTGPQLQFSHAFTAVGRGLHDLTFKYQAPFLLIGFNDVKSLQIYGAHRSEPLLAPVQCLEQLNLIT